ncbi:MAG: S8 family serine peptidase [bacterium]
MRIQVHFSAPRPILGFIAILLLSSFAHPLWAQLLSAKLQDPDRAKVTSQLRSVADYLADQKTPTGVARWAARGGHPGLQMAKPDKEGTIRVVIQLRDDSPDELEALWNLGVTIQIHDVANKRLQARLDPAIVDFVAARPAVRKIKLPDNPVAFTGSQTSQGDALHQADKVRSQIGATGLGVKVGVISDGLGLLSQSQSTGDLGVVTSQSFREDGRIDLGFDGNTGAEGTAMLEIVHDLAPDAELYFSNFETDQEINQAKNWLADQGCRVVVDDIGFFNNGPYDGTSPVSMGSTALVRQGVAYFTSVGNLAQDHYQADYVPGTDVGTNPADNTRVHFFNGIDDPNLAVTVPAGGTLSAFLQWNDPFGLSGNDYDLYVLSTQTPDFTTQNILAASEDFQLDGDDPVEGLAFENTGTSARTVYVYIVGWNPQVRSLNLFVLGNTAQEYSTPARSIINNNEAGGGVISVGAVSHLTPDTIEFYSSLGPTQDNRIKPEVVAADRVVTTVSGYTNFAGTSASAPHAAAVAALILSWNSGLNPAQLATLMQDHSVHLGSPTPNNTFGYGRLDALASIQATPQTVVRYTFPNTDTQGWTFGSAAPAYTAPASAANSGKLKLISTTNSDCFGFWESPGLGIDAGKLYKITFDIQTNAAVGDTPGFRLRVNSVDGQDGIMRVISNQSTQQVAPSAGSPRQYELLFRPSSQINIPLGMKVAVDLVNFNQDAPVDTTIEVESVTIQAVPE